MFVEPHVTPDLGLILQEEISSYRVDVDHGGIVREVQDRERPRHPWMATDAELYCLQGNVWAFHDFHQVDELIPHDGCATHPTTERRFITYGPELGRLVTLKHRLALHPYRHEPLDSL